ncbi:MAG: ATP phosphoribosyltransferase [Candidatus Aenigmatarchaeota archaeon]
MGELVTYVCPKGELSKGSEEFLKSLGIPADLSSKDYVETLPGYWFVRYSGSAKKMQKVRIVKMRSWDVPQITELIGDYGITGKDIFEEYLLSNRYTTRLNKVADLDFGYCGLYILGRKPLENYNQPIRVASPYPKLSERMMRKLGLWSEVNSIPLNRLEGSWEALVDLDLTDVVVDVVNGGKTSEANELKKLEKVLDSNAILIERPK